ncbi:T9SS type B sorting domain-containing protein [Flavobacterium sp.]|uniref:DUF7948 domain-containing protein n=1 Tax=Flavobacterium sp. TaxID=239 RepID=UPI0039E27AE8
MKSKFILFFYFTILPLFSQTGHLSIGFMENKGQVVDQNGKPNNNVKYLLNTNGLNVQLRKSGFSYDIYEAKITKGASHQKFNLQQPIEDLDGAEILYHRIDVEFENANPVVQLIPEGKSKDYDNFYNVAHAPQGILNVHNFKKVTYKNLYDNIDVQFFIPEDPAKPVEYNFIVKPGGDINNISLRFKGGETTLIDNKIRINVRFGQMDETLPLSWVETGTDMKEVSVRYKKIKNNVYGFQSAEDLRNKTIIIDPTPIKLWGTYFHVNSNGINGLTGHAYHICTDMSNNVYLGGDTAKPSNIATAGAVQATVAGIYDGFVTKFDANGARQWGTYYGGNDYDVVSSVYAKDSDLVVLGWTQSASNIATPGAHDTSYNSGTGPAISRRDCFIVKFNLDGVRMWGTYFGGDASEQPSSVTIDVNDNILICGTTYSTNEIATPGAYKEMRITPVAYNIWGEGFVAKFTPAGNRIWGTYYGLGYFTDIDTDSNANVFICGSSKDNPFVATAGTHQLNVNDAPGPGIESDSFLAKFDTNGQRIWGTYYGGYSDEFNYSVRVDLEDNIYISGETTSTAFIATTGAHQTTYEGSTDAYLAKFNQNGILLWGTYYGGTSFESYGTGYKIDINSNNDIFLLGTTSSNDHIATPGSYAENKNGPGTDCFIAKIDKNGQRVWGTYFGGNNVDSGTDIALDHVGGIYVNGLAEGTNGHGTLGAFQQFPIAQPDPFLDKFFDCQSSVSLTANTPTCVGSTIQLSATGGTGYAWTGPNGFTSSLQNPTIPNAAAVNSGQYSCVVTGTGSCDGVNLLNVVVGDNIKPVPDVSPLPIITGDCNTVISAPTATDNCMGVITATTSDALTGFLPGNHTIHWSYNDGNGNIETQNQTVVINAVALPVAASPQNFCIQQNATLASLVINGQNIRWYDALTGGNLLAANTVLINGTAYYASQTISGCESLRIPIAINVYSTATPTTVNALQVFCSTEGATLGSLAITGSNLLWYATATGTTVLPNSTLLTGGTTYYATQTLNGCESVNRLAITVQLINTLNANDFSENICDNLNDGVEMIDLNGYNANLITNTTGCTFAYYTSLSGAHNQNVAEWIANPVNYPLSIGINTIYVRITSSNSCHQVVKLDLTLVRNPDLSIPGLVPICQGNTIAIDAGAGFDSYSWSTTETSQAITISQAGNYSVTVTQNHGTVVCSTTKNFTVVLSNVATITNVETHDWSDSDNTITVLTTGYGQYEFTIDGIHYQESNVFTNLPAGAYTISVRDKNGCGIVNEDVFLLMYPKFFTPNGDGHNDGWAIKFSANEPELKVKLFDRYGKLLQTMNYLDVWDGSYNGQQLPSNDYWFVVTRADGTEYRGHFALKR